MAVCVESQCDALPDSQLAIELQKGLSLSLSRAEFTHSNVEILSDWASFIRFLCVCWFFAFNCVFKLATTRGKKAETKHAERESRILRLKQAYNIWQTVTKASNYCVVV